MPTAITRNIHDSIARLGKDMGFLVEMESTGVYEGKSLHKDEHAPKFDVVWYLDLEKQYNLLPLKVLFNNKQDIYGKIAKLPIAGFEIEGSGTASKYQIGNISNLTYGDFIYKFVIVNNAEAKAGDKLEADTYRRGLKIARYYQDMIGTNNLFFADWVHIEKSIDAMKSILNKKRPLTKAINGNGSLGSGGETASHATRKELYKLLDSTGLIINEDFKPQFAELEYNMYSDLLEGVELEAQAAFLLKRKLYWLPDDKRARTVKSVSDVYYVPKLDIACGITIPFLLAEWMKRLGIELREDVVNYPLLYALLNTEATNYERYFIPIIGVEIETSDNKHLIGGCANLRANTFVGILAAPEACEKRYQYVIDKCGFRNIVYHKIKL